MLLQVTSRPDSVNMTRNQGPRRKIFNGVEMMRWSLRGRMRSILSDPIMRQQNTSMMEEFISLQVRSQHGRFLG